jgi:hypothetical protein
MDSNDAKMAHVQCMIETDCPDAEEIHNLRVDFVLSLYLVSVILPYWRVPGQGLWSRT